MSKIRMHERILSGETDIEHLSASVRKRIKDVGAIGFYLDGDLVARAWIREDTDSLVRGRLFSEYEVSDTSDIRTELLFMEILEEQRTTSEEVIDHLFSRNTVVEIFGTFFPKDEPHTVSVLKTLGADVREASTEDVGISSDYLFIEDVAWTFSIDRKKFQDISSSI